MRLIDNKLITVQVATDFGPRIVGLRPAGGENLFAELGDLGIDLDDGRRFLFRGGHRLWLAPEVPEVAYEPDNVPVEVTAGPGFVETTSLSGGVSKTIRVAVAEDKAEIVVDHRVANRGDETIEVSPWAITQLRTGGTALMPVGSEPPEPDRLQPWASVVGWPYTDWAGLEWDDDRGVIQVPGRRDSPTKIGTVLERGWLAYVVDGWVFAKYATVGPLSIDLGASGQVYVNKDFVELETLGAFVSLEPGESTSHSETWRVFRASGDLTETTQQVEAHS
ncbi:MAG: hypothetical protein WAM81_00745 [Acidimicrobiia bacterium]